MEDFVWKQMLSGQWYDALDGSLIKKLRACQQECFEINQMPPSMIEERNRRIARLLGKAGKDPHFNTPFWCDYGCNIEVGDGTTIGAGSVVTKDIPSGVIAIGNPCHVIKTL